MVTETMAPFNIYEAIAIFIVPDLLPTPRTHGPPNCAQTIKQRENLTKNYPSTNRASNVTDLWWGQAVIFYHQCAISIEGKGGGSCIRHIKRHRHIMQERNSDHATIFSWQCLLQHVLVTVTLATSSIHCIYTPRLDWYSWKILRHFFIQLLCFFSCFSIALLRVYKTD